MLICQQKSELFKQKQLTANKQVGIIFNWGDANVGR